MKRIVTILLTCGYLEVVPQVLTPVQLTVLPTELAEVSGMLQVGGDTWVILDSDNPNTLYRIDPTTGQVLQQMVVENAVNLDWEALATDADHVYVGDIGNNAGARTDLRIHRLSLGALVHGASTVRAETITFNYAEQVDHTPAYDDTNWDAEALVVFEDSLFIFTKNWLDGRTDIHAVPAVPGQYAAVHRGGFDAQGLITDAARDPRDGRVVLLGHTEAEMDPFVWVLDGFAGRAPLAGTRVRYPLATGPLQAEAVAWSTSGDVFFANERTPGQPAALWSLAIPRTEAGAPTRSGVVHAFPVPADRQVRVEGADPQGRSRIYEVNGALLAEPVVQASGDIDLPYLPPGEYVLEVKVRSEPCRLQLVIAH